MLQWAAKWIGYAYDPRQDLGVFAFRNRLVLNEVPEQLTVRVSADNRYKLYVNGSLVAFGPQRGDERHWFYETLDLAPFLHAGENSVVALVWNFGWMAPMAQHTVRTAFVLDSDFESLRTPGAWEVARFDGWDFAMMHSGIGDFYIDVGPGEIIPSCPTYPLPGDADWRPPHVICQAEERGASGGGTPWMLIPRSIPLMRYDERPLRPLTDDVTVEPGQPLLVDYRELLCAYPRLLISGPPGATVTLTYAESLWQEDGAKGNRNEAAGKVIHGYQDKLTLGSEPTTYEPLWWRTYRFLQIEVEGPSPAVLHRLDAIETGYPLVVESTFEADDASVQPIWDVAVRTVERCAGETYFDCPYYEQLQYVGDTRIQALIGYYLGRDRRLQRNAVETLGWSIMENGLTQSRYPSRQTQVIPPFSLWWVMMLYDQMLYDCTGVKPDIGSPQTLSRILGRYRKLSRESGQFWQFADWVPAWLAGVPPAGAHSALHQLTLTLATSAAASLKAHWEGKPHTDFKATRWTDRPHEGIGQYSDHWLVRSGHGDDVDFEHSEALYRLLPTLHNSGESVLPWPTEALAAANAAKCTYYFSYYKHLAMFGRPYIPNSKLQTPNYMAELQPWKQMIEDGLTTFAENPEPTRSDCHAWSAHPILGFFQIVAGVTSIAPAWKKAKIMPHPGSLKRFDARIAHPDGELTVAYENGRLEIQTPVPAELHWQGEQQLLEAGSHKI